MKLLNYFDFILESRQEVQLPCIINKEFLNKVGKIKSPISEKFNLISSFGSVLYRMKSKWTFITVSPDSDKVIFSESWRVTDKIYEIYGEDANCDRILGGMVYPSIDNFLHVGRVEMKVGRFIKAFFGDEFSDSEIEQFVNQWKSLADKSQFEIWSGSDIKRGYASKNYHFNDYDRGMNPLMNSCMNDMSCVSFYQYCREVNLLVLLDKDNSILGRALLWKDEKGRKIMDRVYFVYDKDYYKFVRWADEMGYYYKKDNSGLSKFVKNGVEENITTRVKILNAFLFPEEEYPYMDTFCYIKDDWAYNYEPDGVYWKFINTDGTYEIHDWD
jgi:hypothetical protein